MFGIGATEMVIIGIVLLIAVGPTRLPKLLKAVVSGYREFRRATRELRASTGIDEILEDEDLKDLRKPLHIPPAKAKAKALAAKKRSLSYTERVQENPPEGVDLAEIRDAERRPSPEERDAIIAAKNARLADEEAIRQAKIAAAEEDDPEAAERIRAKIAAAEEARAAAEEQDPEEAERIRAAKIAAAEEQDPEEAERIRAAKIAAAEEQDPEEAERIRAAKIAAAEEAEADEAED